MREREDERDQTPMMKQYWEIKNQYRDAILFFRLGDFYEMFHEDAIRASKLLGITLTSRSKKEGKDIPLCGVPYHSARGYVSKLLEHGLKVAICEQVEDPRLAKGVVRREVTKVITPGLQLDELDERTNNYLLCLTCREGLYGLASIDISTGDFRATELADPDLVRDEVARLGPNEVLLDRRLESEGLVSPVQVKALHYLEAVAFSYDRAVAAVVERLGNDNLAGFGLEGMRPGLEAAGAIIAYVREVQPSMLLQICTLRPFYPADFLVVDHYSRQNLELFQTIHGERRSGNLLAVMDRTATAMGGRLLREWFLFPLRDRKALERRQALVERSLNEPLLRERMRTLLSTMSDLERLIGRVVTATVNARDLVALRRGLALLPELRTALLDLDPELTRELVAHFQDFASEVDLLERAIVDDPPLSLTEGGVIKQGYDPALDELLEIQHGGRDWILRFEQQERQRTGISSLKVRYNRVFGYSIEVTRTNLKLVPEDYQRRQTLAGAERFVTEALKEQENKILEADERRRGLEYDLFCQVRTRLAERAEAVRRVARAVASLDVLLCFATLAEERSYVRPEFREDGRLIIEDGRHPVIEVGLREERFIPNDVQLDCEEEQLLLITGPNMAGKSTIIRQVALISFLAQLGSFVPASRAQLPLVDRIFTRVGASDNISRGQSTFMVEMTETANILRNATRDSLIVLDEIGRGTSTYDGLSLAWAIAEYLHDHVRGKTLFATHFHELTELARVKERVRNYHVAVKEWQDSVIFLRKLVEGAISRSYGIEVARLAGLPELVILRAREILRNLEAGELDHYGRPNLAESRTTAAEPPTGQLQLFAPPPPNEVIEELRRLDVLRLTPLEALVALDKLKRKAG